MEEEVRRSARPYVEAAKAIENRWCLEVWMLRKRLPPMQTLLPHLLYHSITYFNKEELLGKAKITPAKLWNGKWLVILNVYEVG